MKNVGVSCSLIQVIEICICRAPCALAVPELYTLVLYFIIDQYLLEGLQTTECQFLHIRRAF